MAGWLSDAAKYNPVSWSAETIRTVVINGTLTASQMGSIELWLGGLAILATILLLMAYFVSEKEIRE
jgi:ABC-2 type transport system permease protein